MVATYGSLAVICVTSLAVGGAILRLAGGREWSWLAAPVGLAALTAIAGLTIRLPGHGIPTLVLIAIALAASLAFLRRQPGLGAAIREGLPVALLCVLVGSLPFALNGHLGLLGVSFENDTAAHILSVDWLRDGIGPRPDLIGAGYPIGSHGLAVAAGRATGANDVSALNGLTLAIPLLIAFTALAGLPRRRLARPAAAVLVGFAYLLAAAFSEGEAKEPMQALFMLGFALWLGRLREGDGPVPARRGIPLGVLAAGSAYTYSFPGLLGLGAITVVWLTVETVRAKSTRALLAGLGVLAIAVAPELVRMFDFGGYRTFAPPGPGLGNLVGQVSPLEVFGVWARADWRFDIGPVAAVAAALVGVAALALGVRWAWRHEKRRGLVAALVAALATYLAALAFGTPYTAAKALKLAAPLVMLVALGGLMARPAGSGASRVRPDLARALLAALFVAGAAYSSFLVLRDARVGPHDHAAELARLRPAIHSDRVLVLARDDYLAHELRGLAIYTQLVSHYEMREAPARPATHAQRGWPLDFDAFGPRVLNRFRYMITSASLFASAPKPGLRPIQATPNYVLWERTGRTPFRGILAEGDKPGRKLDCSMLEGRRLSRRPGVASVLPVAPVVGPTEAWSRVATSSEPAVQSLRLAPGRWQLSLQYGSQEPLLVSAAGLHAVLPARLDEGYEFSPYWPIGTIRAGVARPVSVTVRVAEPNRLSRLLGRDPPAQLGKVVAMPLDRAARLVPLRAACGRYVDWYRLRR